MKKIAEALRMKAKKMEESEHAAHISPKDLKQLATDAAKLEKAAEKLKAAFDKKFNKKDKPASAPKAEKVEALQETTMENFNLKKFLVENKLTTNSRMLNEEYTLADLGPDFERTAKEIFGDTVKIQDIKATYRPSTDTGDKPQLSMSVTIPSVGDRDSYKGVLAAVGFWNKDGKGEVYLDNYSKDKQGTVEEFKTKLAPALRKAAMVLLGKVVKNPEALSQATVGLGYKYEEKDQADLDNYITQIPNLPVTFR